MWSAPIFFIALKTNRNIYVTVLLFYLEGADGRATPLPKIEIEPVNTDDVEAALKHTKPSARQLKDKYKDWQKEYESV